MKKEWEKVITDTLGVEPIEINSNLVSAQNRPRLYWTNIPIEEWTKWVEPLYDAEIIKVVRAYIEKNGVFSEFDYGFDYWMRIMDTLNFLKKKYSMKENKDCSLWQIPEEKLSFQIGGAVSESAPAPDFCKFIYSFLKDNPSKE